jgi:hypothetical protein
MLMPSIYGSFSLIGHETVVAPSLRGGYVLCLSPHFSTPVAIVNGED